MAVGVGRSSLWRWVAQAEIDGGEAPGATIEENEETCRLWAENRRLREDVATLKAATTFFVGALDPAFLQTAMSTARASRTRDRPSTPARRVSSSSRPMSGVPNRFCGTEEH